MAEGFLSTGFGPRRRDKPGNDGREGRGDNSGLWPNRLRLRPRTDGRARAIPLEEQFNVVASYVALAIEVGAVIVVSLGAFQAISGVLGAILTGTAGELRGREIWLKFATWILLALEFALAADIVRTAVAPTWEDIWKLAVIAAIRTMLNYSLAKDIAAFEAQDSAQNSAQNPPSAQATT
ncbi:MAG: DUF1622 domain-containing protein [Methyloceanibacter sp.]|uniref:DUF1622 domain-containing protein n=1 Tax=Methyloceanibacter sp. TaxID=1965321 RepID=UPI003D6D4126